MKTVRAVTEINNRSIDSMDRAYGRDAAGSRNILSAVCGRSTVSSGSISSSGNMSNKDSFGSLFAGGHSRIGGRVLRAGLAAAVLSAGISSIFPAAAFAEENAQGITAVAVTGTALSGKTGTGPSGSTAGGTAGADSTASRLSDDNLEWEEITDLVHSYNATVIKNRDDLSTDARKSYNAKEVSDYLLQKADEYENEAYNMDDTSAVTAASYRSTANSLRIQAESNVSDFEVIKLEYELIEKQTAQTVRNTFLNFYSSMYETEYDEANAAYLEKVYASAQNKMNVGMATETDVLTAKENLDAAKAALVKIRADHASYKNSLITMCGWKYDSTSAVIGKLPEMSAASVESIDYESDRAKAEVSNLTLKMDEIKLKNANSGSYNALIIKQNQDQLDNDKKSFEINFKSAYDTLVNAASAYTNAVNDKAVADRNLETASRQLELGSISNMDHEGYKNSAASAHLAECKAYISLLSAKAAYDAALDGNL